MHHYFLIEPLESEKNMELIDYIADENLISDELKNLMEMYLPKLEYESVKKEGKIFWKFNPPVYEGCGVEYNNDIISKISFISNTIPLAFTISSPKRKYVIVRLAIVESILRRGILGLKFRRISTKKQEDE